ncbi:MAG: phosphoglycerate mutase (2,3-diphosphoglycerate-independent) [Phycisphaerae bacterium]|nr:phosphoglycerate mutase (2,3-diphosphoglycerate-independent) [Phycisphaerae bacterium]
MPTAPHLLIIRDGWGMNPHPEHDAFNAVKLANTPVADRLMAEWPWTLVKSSGEDVGLTEGTMGNSEVGHQNIGAGRVVYQDAVRISIACRDGKLAKNDALVGAIKGAKDAGKATHLMGINSDAGVHGQLIHLEALVRLCKQLGQQKVFIHLFGDGRDTGPFLGKGYAAQVEAFCAEIGVGRVVSVVGRYWAMDRDNRWERVKRAYDLLTGRGETPPVFASATAAIQDFYDHPDGGETLKGDEFTSPRVVGDDWNDTRITDGDAVIFYNYRGDRPREICSAFLLPIFHGADELKPSPDSGEHGFDRGEKLDLRFVLLTPYSERLAQLAPVAFPKQGRPSDILGEHVSKSGLSQFRCAETEKFPHVTFFFNNGADEPFEGEHREIIQSPKVATYDLQPEMSARAVADAVLARLNADDCESLLVVNFANGDMVGHTGSVEAAVKSCETVDALTGELVDACLARGGSCIVTADHGNAEQMFSPENNGPHTAHTLYDVPLIVVAEKYRHAKLRGDQDAGGYLDPEVRAKRGRLADIAPTSLQLMGLDKPEAMTGHTLIVG